MGYRVVKVPDEGDCFFHVVACFLAHRPDDAGAARTVRRELARRAARLLFKAPYDDLDTLTDLVLRSTKPGDLAGVQASGLVAADSLGQYFAHSIRGDAGNGGNASLPVFVVWMQYSVAEIAKLRKAGHAPWARLACGFLQYTIWGDGAFFPSLVLRRYGRRVHIYNAHNAATVDTNDGVVNLFHKNGNHFDALFHEEDEEEDEDELDLTALPGPDLDNLTLEIHHLDVGQGDSTLILVRWKRKILHSVLIDAGDKGQAPFVHAYMQQLGLVNLDTLVVTHYDKDHFRGVIALAAESSICQRARIFDRGDPWKGSGLETPVRDLTKSVSLKDDRLYEDELEELRELLSGPTAKKRMNAGLRASRICGRWLFRIGREGKPPILTLRCVAAGGWVQSGDFVTPLHSDRENGMSLAFLLRFGDCAYLLGGDAPGVPGNDLEGAIAAYAMDDLGLDHVCGLRVSHHGSHHSTKPKFVAKVRPTTAFVSSGIHRKFHHPRQGPIDALVGQKTLQGAYFTCCAYRREHITPHGRLQTGRMRVAGDERTSGTIVLTLEHAATKAHVFYVGYWDRELGAWRTERHCCKDPKLQEEITPSGWEDLTGSCDTSKKTGIALEDEIQKVRDRATESVVRSLRMRRDARRCHLTGMEDPPVRELRTVETKEMLDELDRKTQMEIEEMEEIQQEAESEYEEESEFEEEEEEMDDGG